MKIKTRELMGAALDWAVAQCENKAWLAYENALNNESPLPPRPSECLRDVDYYPGAFSPSTDWAKGGPIIERANITLIRADDDYEVDAKGFCTSKRIPSWFAECNRWSGHTLTTSYESEPMEPTFMVGELDGCYGPTPLTASMRCYVASKLGDEVDIPDTLINQAT